MIDRYDYVDYVRDYLKDYNDNFTGEPCAEIIDEVLGCLEIHDGMTESEVLKSIEAICEEMFG